MSTLLSYVAASELATLTILGKTILARDGDNVGIGTITIPHGGIGSANFAIDGPNASVNGPHVQFTTTSDNYPVFQQLNWAHDDIELFFDAYYDGNFKSSDIGSNFLIIKRLDKFSIQYASGIAQGDIITWNNGIILHNDGGVLMGDLKSGATQGGAGAVADELWTTLGHATLLDNIVMIGV